MGSTGASAQLSRLAAAVATPGTHRRPVAEVEVRATEHSVLFLADERVYKVRRPLALVDAEAARPEERRRQSEEELRLNRRLAPHVYLGVLAVTRESDGRLVLDGTGEPVDWMLEMKRLPAERRLANLLARDEVEEAELEAVAVVLARFHERAMTGPVVNRHGLPQVVARAAQDCVAALAQGTGSTLLAPAMLAFLRRRAAEFPAERRELLERRVAEWRIRDGHGDLQAGDVYLGPGLDVTIVGVEPDRDRRCGDVAADLAGLAVDLDHRGHPRLADVLVGTYARLTGDADLECLTRFYASSRALQRAARALARAAADEASGAHAGEAARYAQLALGYELPAALVLAGGPAAAQQRLTLAYVASRLRAPCIPSTPVRADGTGDAEPAGAEALLEHATAELARGRSAVVEASFARRAFRRPFADAATRLGVPCHVLWFEDDAAPVDGRPDARFDAPDEFPAERVLRVRGARPREETCGRLQERLVAGA